MPSVTSKSKTYQLYNKHEAGEEIHALVTAQIHREVEEWRERTPVKKQRVEGASDAQNAKHAPEAVEEKAADDDAEQDRTSSPGKLTGGGPTQEDENDETSSPTQLSSIWSPARTQSSACPHTCRPEHKAILRQVAVNLSITNRHFDDMVAELLTAIHELWLANGEGSLEAAAEEVVQDVLNRGTKFNNLESVGHQIACAMWLLQCVKAGIYHPATDQCNHERMTGFSVLGLWALPFTSAARESKKSDIW